MRLLLALFSLTAISVSSMHMPKKAAPPEYDIIIRNGQIVDGSGRPGYKADVAIKNDRVARIGNLRGAKAAA